MESRSQYGEDLKAWEILERWGITSGRVLEIGAWDHTALSNSRMFIEAGFGALLVEPSPLPLRNLAREYAGSDAVTVVGTPITATGGLITLQITDDALSGETIPEQWKESGGHFGRISVWSVSMKDFFAQFGGDFALVSIDTEGSSVSLFREMVKCGPRPRVVILEHDSMYVEVARIAEAANYQQVTLNGTNVVLEWTGRQE